MDRGEDIAAAARALIGTRFRPQGRDPAYGLDCVGLVLRSLAGGGIVAAAPCDYAQRGGSAEAAARLLREAGLHAVETARAGDVLLLSAGPGQLHLGIRTGAGMVHADVGLRRVVERPGAAAWPVAGIWRS